MKTKMLLTGILLVSATMLSAATNDLTSLLQQGMLEEEASHDLRAAITDYQSLAAQFDQDREIAATAIYRLGECYRKLGQTNEAAAQYERIVREFPDQKTLVTLCQQNLTGLGVAVSAAPPFENPDVKIWDEVKNLPPSQLESILPTIYPDPKLSDLLNRRTELQADLDKLQERYAAANPLVVQAKTDLKESESQIAARIEGIMQTLKTRAEIARASAPSAAPPAAAAALQAQQAFLQDEITVVEKELDERQSQYKNGLVPNDEVLAMQQKLLELKQQVAALQANLAGYTPTTAPTDAEDQKISELKAMIQNSPDLINAPGGENGNPPLVQAALDDQLRVAQFLLDHNADVNDSRSPLTAAASTGHKAMLELLLAHGADVNAGDLGDTPLHAAARQGFLAVAEVLLANHADVNALSTEGRSPLSFAAQKDSLEMIKLLLAAKADPNAGTLDAPLLCAIKQKDLASVELLLQAGANPNAPGPVNLSIHQENGAVPQFIAQRQPITPLWLAIFTKQPPMAAALLDAGAKADPIDIYPEWPYTTPFNDDPNWTLLSSAADHNDAAVVDILLQHGANPNARNPDNMTPLHWAAWGLAGTNVVELLLAHGADPNVRDNHGKTPLDYVKDSLNGSFGDLRAKNPAVATAVADLLRRHGALDNLPNWDLITVSRPTNYSQIVFTKGTNDWNHFTLLEMFYRAYGNGDFAATSFPDFSRISVVRPGASGAPEKRIEINLVNATNSVDCEKDIPLEFGDTVEIPEREHTLTEQDTWLRDQMQMITSYFRDKAGTVTLVVAGGQTIPLPLNQFAPVDCYIGALLKSTMARNVLTSASDLANLKVTRQDPKNGQTNQWQLDCSHLQFQSPPLYNCPGLWLRDGDVIEVPEKL